MYEQILEMYERTNLQYSDDYYRSQKERLHLMEKVATVPDALKYARELLADYPEHPYEESIEGSKNRLDTRMLNR